MPNIKSLDTVYLVLTFLVPGLVATFVRAQFITGRVPSHAEAALTYLTLSLIYYALALPIVGHSIPNQISESITTFAWVVLIFVGPALFGLLLGLNAQKEWLRKILRRMGLYPVHVVPAAWDWKFGNMKEEWVLVVLKNGTRWAGFCGQASFTSSDPKERDVYVEKVYELDKDDLWQPRESSVLITAGEISTIEFWPYRPQETAHDG